MKVRKYFELNETRKIKEINESDTGIRTDT